MGKVVRQLGIEPQLLPGDGVDKAQRFGVQTLTERRLQYTDM